MRLKTVLIIEDEKPNAERLKRLLHQLRPNVEILSTEEYVSSSVAFLKNKPQPDLIMMDIRLSDGLCFEIFNHVEVSSFIIFTTAYDEYALKGFKYNSIDYLLKPIKPNELEAALQRYENLLTDQFLAPAALEGLADYLNPKRYRKKFLLAFRDGYKSLFTEDILYFYSEWGTTKAMLKSNAFEVVPQTLDELEHQLDPSVFFRANRQVIVHIDAIKNVFNHFNGKLKVEVKYYPDLEVLVSREKSSAFKAWMDY